MQEFCGEVPIEVTGWVSSRWSKSNPNSNSGFGNGVSVSGLGEESSENSPEL